MFARAAIQGVLNDLVSVPHVVRSLAPFAFEITPEGRKPGELDYRVVAERAAFELRCELATGYMSIALRAAVIAGASSNPQRVAALKSRLSSRNWTPEVELSEQTFRVAAFRRDVANAAEHEQMTEAVIAAAAISEFVLDQLLITKPYGEMRPAVLRAIAERSEPHDPWSYDPSERDRSTAVHRALENWLIERLREAGVDAFDPAGEPFFDVAWRVGRRLFVCEVKSTINSEAEQLRLGLGQVLHYVALLARASEEATEGVVLVSDRPRDTVWTALFDGVGVHLLWPSRWPELQDRLTAEDNR